MSKLALKQLKEALRNGPYAWPGGYPLYFIAGDFEALSFKAVQDNLKEAMRQTYDPKHGREWRIVGVHVNWEDQHLYCAHTNERIPSAYGEED
jgi:hypothetical protein